MTETTQPSTEKFNSWAIIEIMGHQRLAGKVTEQTIAGTAMLRVEVPEVTYDEKDWNAPIFNAVKQHTLPAFTTFIGGSSIYRLTPCSQEMAIAAIKEFRQPPVTCVRLQLPAPIDNSDPINEDQNEDDGE